MDDSVRMEILQRVDDLKGVALDFQLMETLSSLQ